MHMRIMSYVALLVVALANSIAKGEDAVPRWILDVPWLHAGGDRPFQFRVSIRTTTQDLVGYVSWVPPDRRCLILTDRSDGLPLMIAVDGRVWVYDLIGGQILLVRAEPEFRMDGPGEGAKWRWGMRADFPDLDSRRTIDVDVRQPIVSYARERPEAFSTDAETRTATFKYKDIETSLKVTNTDPPLPIAFSLEQGAQYVNFRLDSFTFEKKVPEWHRAIDRDALAKVVPVVAIADAAHVSPEKRERIQTVRTLLHAGALFIPRMALRDAEFRQRIEKSGRFKLDFDEIRANDEKLRDPWRKALLDQKIRLPQSAPATQPGSPMKDASHGTR
jgi:hypothetical protein